MAEVAVLTTVGAAIRGTLTFDYGFNVEADRPLWHHSEDDLLPGHESPCLAETQPPPRKRLVR